MYANERIKAILDQLNSTGVVLVKDLSAQLKVTEETVRRDLDKIGVKYPDVQRIRGGAYKVNAFDKEVPLLIRETLYLKEKRNIAKFCIEQISPGCSVMLDSSSTAYYIADLIRANNLEISVITNSLRIVQIFENYKQANVICIGGAYRSRSNSFVGYQATSVLSNFHSDLAFVSCSGLNEKFGITDHNEGEAQVRRLMLANADKRFLIADYTKLGRCSINRIATFDEVDCIVTNEAAPEEWKVFFDQNNIAAVFC